MKIDGNCLFVEIYVKNDTKKIIEKIEKKIFIFLQIKS